MSSSSDDNSQELQNARDEKRGYESSKEDKEALYEQNVGKISRLRTVKTNLENQKEYAKDRKDSIGKYVEEPYNFADWYGNMQNNTSAVMSLNIVPYYKSYVERIDEVLDSVNDKITALENKNMQLNGDILRLASLINSLANKIENLLN